MLHILRPSPYHKLQRQHLSLLPTPSKSTEKNQIKAPFYLQIIPSLINLLSNHQSNNALWFFVFFLLIKYFVTWNHNFIFFISDINIVRGRRSEDLNHDLAIAGRSAYEVSATRLNFRPQFKIILFVGVHKMNPLWSVWSNWQEGWKCWRKEYKWWQMTMQNVKR